MAISLRYLIFFLALNGTGATLIAQPLKEPLTQRATVVRFYYYSLTPPGANVALNEPTLAANLDLLKTPARIEIEPSSSTNSMTYFGDGPLVLYNTVNTENGTTRKVVATVPLPPNQKGVLFFVTYIQGKYNFKPLPYSSDGVPSNHVKVINFCPVPLALQFESSQALIPANGEILMNVKDSKNVIRIKVARQMGDFWVTDISVMVPGIKEDERLLFLLLPDSPALNRVILLPMGELPDPHPEPDAL
jgi:hypothetical protein